MPRSTAMDGSLLQTNHMQSQEQYPPPQDRLTPLPLFVKSYHNPPDPFGGPGATINGKTTAKHDSESLTAAPNSRSDRRQLTRRISSLQRQGEHGEIDAAVAAVTGKLRSTFRPRN